MKKYTVTLLCLGILGCQNSPKNDELRYPKWEGEAKTEKRFGQAIEDPNSNLMALSDSTVQNWFKAQDSLAEAYLASNPETLSYLERFTELENRNGQYVSQLTQSESGDYFFLKDDEQGNQRVYVQRNLAHDPVSLFDPGKLGKISYLEPSYNGRYLAMGIPQKGGFASTIHFLEVDTGRLLPDVVRNCNPDFGGIEWLPDSSGFIYLFFPEVDKEKPGYKRNSYSALYRMGQKKTAPFPIFGQQVGVDIPSDHYPKVKLGSSLDTRVIGYKASSSNFYDAFITKIEDVLSGQPKWEPFFAADEKIFYNQGEVRGNHFVYRKATDHGNELCQVNLDSPNFENPEILATGSQDNPITKFEVTQDHIYFLREHFGVSVTLYLLEHGERPTETQLPFAAGYADFFGESLVGNRLGIVMDGWTSDTKRYTLENGQLEPIALDSPVDYPEFGDLMATQVMIDSHDGTKVPLSLVHKKDLVLDGTHEVFVYVYGAYGDSMSPFFYPVFLDWAAQGGVLAFPHVRGGGEKGPEWHREGQKELKHNSWKDLLACMDHLIEKQYTQKGRIALYTNSAGGVTAGMAVNERPGLFGSLIAEFPRLHPYGLEASQDASSTSYMEYGSVKDSTECLGLLRMDPYLNLDSQKKYPATLVLTSYNDDRIPLWDNGKYVAKRQAMTPVLEPILMDIDYEVGHESLSDYESNVILNSKIFGFAKTHMRE